MNRYKTNLKCEGCVAKIKPALDAWIGEDTWNVDLNHSDKVLEITEKIDSSTVITLLQNSGFKAEKLEG